MVIVAVGIVDFRHRQVLPFFPLLLLRLTLAYWQLTNRVPSLFTRPSLDALGGVAAISSDVDRHIISSISPNRPLHCSIRPCSPCPSPNVSFSLVRHNSAYILLTSYLEFTPLSGLFNLSLILEIPTLHLALSTLFPLLRHDLLFLTMFFIFRIGFHAYLIISFGMGSGRALSGVEGSWIPFTVLVMAYPMHLLWFAGGVNGHRKRVAKNRRENREVKMQGKARRMTAEVVASEEREETDIRPYAEQEHELQQQNKDNHQRASLKLLIDSTYSSSPTPSPSSTPGFTSLLNPNTSTSLFDSTASSNIKIISSMNTNNQAGYPFPDLRRGILHASSESVKEDQRYNQDEKFDGYEERGFINTKGSGGGWLRRRG